MSDEKTQADPQQAKTPNSEEPSTWTMPFPEMMAKMMTCCRCRPEQMKTMWATCCGSPAEKKENPETA